jgi:putative ABC transport system permease protein
MTLEDIKESTKMALETVWENKLRSILTISGVTVGVLTVMIMVSIIQGLNRSFAEQIEALGSNTIFISKFSPSFGRPPGQEERMRKELTMDDAQALRDEVPQLVGVSPLRRKLAEVIRYKEKQSDTPILFGVTPYYEFVHSQYLDTGRFITDTDVRERTNIAVLGRDVKKALFGDEDPVGKDVKVGGYPFHVVGVMGDLGQFFGQSRDNSIFIPISTFEKYYKDIPMPEVVFVIVARPSARDVVKPVIEEIKDVMRRRRQVPIGGKDNFGVSSQDSLLDIYNQLTGATYLVLTAVSAVALMIGGIGVMNIMLVSVTERTKEIGIRKAVGATHFDILSQFLIEAVVLTAIGGIIGLLIGEGVSLLINTYSPLPAFVPLWAILVGLGMSALVGIVFGMYPAWKAARLDPIDALRYE